jgi:hypothetical protein
MEEGAPSLPEAAPLLPEASAGHHPAQSPAPPQSPRQAQPQPGTASHSQAQLFEATDKVVGIEQLTWDLLGTQGSVRRLREERVFELVKSLLADPPTKPLRLIVWRGLDGRYTILGGQHIMAAAKEILKTRRATNGTVQAWMTQAECDVVRYDVCRSERERIAGRHHATQHDGYQLKFWEHMELILRELHNNDEDGLQACTLAAVEKAGVVTRGERSNICYLVCYFRILIAPALKLLRIHPTTHFPALLIAGAPKLFRCTDLTPFPHF